MSMELETKPNVFNLDLRTDIKWSNIGLKFSGEFDKSNSLINFIIADRLSVKHNLFHS